MIPQVPLLVYKIPTNTFPPPADILFSCHNPSNRRHFMMFRSRYFGYAFMSRRLWYPKFHYWFIKYPPLFFPHLQIFRFHVIIYHTEDISQCFVPDISDVHLCRTYGHPDIHHTFFIPVREQYAFIANTDIRTLNKYFLIPAGEQNIFNYCLTPRSYNNNKKCRTLCLSMAYTCTQLWLKKY